jgi:hypothetical protein
VLIETRSDATKSFQPEQALRSPSAAAAAPGRRG